MYDTIFETLTQIILPSRSANAILYYIENKGWFKGFRVSGGYCIPYSKWLHETMIPITKIEVLSTLLLDRKGRIYYENDMIHICESEKKPFQSKPPREHIKYICCKHNSSFVLTQYLEEFYYYDIYNYKYDNSRLRYSIPYDLWNELFRMLPEDVDELGKVITSGYFRIVYNEGQPCTVDICL